MTKERIVQAVLSAASSETGVTVEDILGPRKILAIARARMLVMDALRHTRLFSLQDCVTAVRRIDHGTAHSGLRSLDRACEQNASLGLKRQSLRSLASKLSGRIPYESISVVRAEVLPEPEQPKPQRPYSDVSAAVSAAMRMKREGVLR